jgi:hypothetical protein
MSTLNSPRLNGEKTLRKITISKQKVRDSVDKKLESGIVQKWVIQERDHSLFSGWRNLDWTVRYTLQEAEEMLREIGKRKLSSNYESRPKIFKIHGYWEKDGPPKKVNVLSSPKKSKAKINPLTKAKRHLEQALKALNQIPSNQEHDASYDDPIYR